MAEIEEYEAFLLIWNSIPKEEVVVTNGRRHTKRYTIACTCGHLHLLLTLIIRENGRVSEEITVVDPLQPIAVDRILLKEVSQLDTPKHVLDLQELQKLILHWEEPVDKLCREAMENQLLWLQANPKRAEEQLRSLKPHADVVGTLSGWLTVLQRQ